MLNELKSLRKKIDQMEADHEKERGDARKKRKQRDNETDLGDEEAEDEQDDEQPRLKLKRSNSFEQFCLNIQPCIIMYMSLFLSFVFVFVFVFC